MTDWKLAPAWGGWLADIYVVTLAAHTVVDWYPPTDVTAAGEISLYDTDPGLDILATTFGATGFVDLVDWPDPGDVAHLDLPAGTYYLIPDFDDSSIPSPWDPSTDYGTFVDPGTGLPVASPFPTPLSVRSTVAPVGAWITPDVRSMQAAVQPTDIVQHVTVEQSTDTTAGFDAGCEDPSGFGIPTGAFPIGLAWNPVNNVWDIPQEKWTVSVRRALGFDVTPSPAEVQPPGTVLEYEWPDGSAQEFPPDVGDIGLLSTLHIRGIVAEINGDPAVTPATHLMIAQLRVIPSSAWTFSGALEPDQADDYTIGADLDTYPGLGDGFSQALSLGGAVGSGATNSSWISDGSTFRNVDLTQLGTLDDPTLSPAILLVFGWKDQITHTAPTAGSVGIWQGGTIQADISGMLLISTYQPTRHRYRRLAIPLRQYPRDDFLGGAPRQGRRNNSRSVQGSARQGWRNTYR
jgi:hypothetical protein